MENVIAFKSHEFAIRSINLYKFLVHEKKEFVLSKQLLRSEANETEYWLMLL